MNRLLFLAIGVALLLGSSQIEGRACTCDLPLGNQSLKALVKKAKKQSQAVFAGRVIEIFHKPDSYGVLVKFRVENSWKTKLPLEVTVSTGRGGGDCGFRFEAGESYLVYASGSSESRLSTNICQRTVVLSGAGADLKLLGKGKTLTKN